MKKILFILEHLNANGAERSLISLLRHLDYTKYRVDLLLLQEYGDSIHELPDEVNVHLYSLKNSFGPLAECIRNAISSRDLFSVLFRCVYMLASRTGWEQLALSRPLFKKIDRHYDAVIAYRHSLCTDFAAYVFRGKKLIGWWHHGIAPESKRDVMRIQKAYEKLTDIVAVSKGSAAIVEQSFSSARGKISIIPNIIDCDELVNKSSAYEVRRDDSCFTIVSVGRFAPEKNMKFCVEVGKRLREMHVEYNWYLIGDGEEYETVKTAIVEKGLEDNFILTGRLQNPLPFVKNADVFFHPSTVESQGLSVLESMALGTPVVVVRSLGPQEYIRQGENGILVGINEEESAEQLLSVLNNKRNASKMVENAKKTVELYSAEAVISKFDHLVGI